MWTPPPPPSSPLNVNIIIEWPLTLFTLRDILTQNVKDVCLQTYRNNRIWERVAYFLRKKKQTSWVNNSTILRFNNAKLSGYCFYMKQSIQLNFQICISVPLNKYSLVHICIKLCNFSFLVVSLNKCISSRSPSYR